MKKIFNLAKKEFIQTFRDKKMLPVIFVAPVIQLILLGYAVTTDVKHIYLAVIDRDNSVESRELVGAALNSGYFDLKQGVEKESEIEEALRSGKADFVLYVPPNYSKNIKMNKKASFQVIADGSDATLTGIGLNYLNEIVQRKNKEIRDKIMNSRAGLLGKSISFPRVSPEVKIMYNPELKSANYMVPGVMALILTLMTMLLTSMSITKEKENGTLEQLVVSPLKPYEIILGKTLPFVIIGMVDVVLVITGGIVVFNIPILGSVWLLAVCSLIFIMSTLGIGLFISTISRTQQQAMLTTFMFIFPAMILSGFVFPVTNMPEPAQYLTYLIPLRYFLTIIRGIILKGNGIEILWPEIAALIIFGVVIFTLSSMRFRKKLG
ncbi:MAG: ABC transporter permease [Candidatus Firestonebacteria bacterium RIFOXYC2_FULL_39_67]|nr:MAG: ABC transporter permease [Candidatus Firestonebacteria bacterium RIFOXYD2_FULL_39_29]OGF55865.1 MAG: ABC transporter permease [Candidatus Firestonebacteria bacterium RIFOXYC2_FULL_39_67]